MAGPIAGERGIPTQPDRLVGLLSNQRLNQQLPVELAEIQSYLGDAAFDQRLRRRFNFDYVSWQREVTRNYRDPILLLGHWGNIPTNDRTINSALTTIVIDEEGGRNQRQPVAVSIAGIGFIDGKPMTTKEMRDPSTNNDERIIAARFERDKRWGLDRVAVSLSMEELFYIDDAVGHSNDASFTSDLITRIATPSAYPRITPGVITQAMMKKVEDAVALQAFRDGKSFRFGTPDMDKSTLAGIGNLAEQIGFQVKTQQSGMSITFKPNGLFSKTQIPQSWSFAIQDKISAHRVR